MQISFYEVLQCGATIHVANFGTYCRRRQYMHGKIIIPETRYAVGRKYVPRVPALIAAGNRIRVGATIYVATLQ